MKSSTTNRLLPNTLRMLCSVAALTACSTWASIAPWQLNPISTASAIEGSKDVTGFGALGIEILSVADSANQLQLESAPESGDVSETVAAFVGTLKTKPEARGIENPLAEPATLTQGGDQISSSGTQSVETFAGFNTSTPAAPQPGGALASAFDEEFVSVPNIQFASTAPVLKDASVSSASVTAVPEMSAFFPILGLIAAVSCTQILRRRRAAQNTARIA